MRSISARLGARLGIEIHPVSLRHSNRIPKEELGGLMADTWRHFLEREIGSGAKRFMVMPLFFGESSAIIDYLPEVTEKVIGAREDIKVRVAKPLVDLEGGDNHVTRILRALIVEKLDTFENALKPVVVLVDHGSPVERVADARNLVAEQLAGILGNRVSSVVAASMERRKGVEYDFNEPLLEGVLDQLGESAALLSFMFFSPGRHAGPGGDIESIVKQSGKVVVTCDLVGESDGLIDLLETIAINFVPDL